MLKKGRRIVALLMCVLVGVMMFSVVSFAEEDVKFNFYITADKTSVNEGDTVTVTVYNKAMTVSSFTGGFAFDTSIFEVTAIEKNSDILPRGSVVSSLEEANSQGTVGFGFTDAYDYTYEPGTVLTAVLKAKKGGSTRFESYEDSAGTDETRYDAGGSGSTVIEINLAPVPEKPATCTEAGYEAYWIDEETGTMYSDAEGKNQIDEPVVIPATGHQWGTPTYSWSDDNMACTGLVKCTACGAEEDEAATVTKTSTAATCTIPELITYKAAFTDGRLETQTKIIEGAPATGHTWGEPTYTWSDDNAACTGRAKCTVCGDEKEEAAAVSKTSEAATCTAPEQITYEATFTDKMFEKQTKTVEGAPATGHQWGTPIYTWSDDNTACTGLVKCTACGEEAEATATVSKERTDATCTVPELFTYQAVFTDDRFATQTKIVEGEPATGHTWGEPTYTWAADNSSVTATHVCEVCQEKESETATASSETTATCTEAGKTTYKATFKNAAFSVQTKTVETPALGHDWSIVDDSVKWTGSDEAGYTAATANVKCTRCGEIKENVKSEKVTELVAENGDKFYTAYFQVDNCTLVSVPKIVKAPEKKADGGGTQPVNPNGGKAGDDKPPTGDDNAMWLYVSGMIAAAMLIAGCGIALRRKAVKNNK